MYLILGYSAVATVFFILMYLVGRHNQLKRYSKEEPDPDKATMSTEEDHVMNAYL